MNTAPAGVFTTLHFPCNLLMGPKSSIHIKLDWKGLPWKKHSSLTGRFVMKRMKCCEYGPSKVFRIDLVSMYPRPIFLFISMDVTSGVGGREFLYETSIDLKGVI